MPLASQLEIGNRFFALFVGHSGAGKTPSACSFVDSHPTKMVKIFDFDARLTSLFNTPWVDRSRIDFTYYPPIRFDGSTKSVNDKLEEDLLLFRRRVIEKDRDYDFNTLILDGLPAAAFALMQDILPKTHENGKGKSFGSQEVAGPEDYFYENQGITKIIAILKVMPVNNVIVTCHIEDEYEKQDPKNQMSRYIKVSEKLAIRNKLASNVPGLFDHIFRFDHRIHTSRNNIYVTFWSDIARTVYPNLPVGEVDITGKSFYKELMEMVKNGTRSQSTNA
jgi:hypothetical protein